MIEKYHFFDKVKFRRNWPWVFLSEYFLLIEIMIFFNKYFNWHLYNFRTVDNIIFRGAEKYFLCFLNSFLAKILFSSKLWYFQDFSMQLNLSVSHEMRTLELPIGSKNLFWSKKISSHRNFDIFETFRHKNSNSPLTPFIGQWEKMMNLTVKFWTGHKHQHLKFSFCHFNSWLTTKNHFNHVKPRFTTVNGSLWSFWSFFNHMVDHLTRCFSRNYRSYPSYNRPSQFRSMRAYRRNNMRWYFNNCKGGRALE